MPDVDSVSNTSRLSLMSKDGWGDEEAPDVAQGQFHGRNVQPKQLPERPVKKKTLIKTTSRVKNKKDPLIFVDSKEVEDARFLGQKAKELLDERAELKPENKKKRRVLGRGKKGRVTNAGAALKKSLKRLKRKEKRYDVKSDAALEATFTNQSISSKNIVQMANARLLVHKGTTSNRSAVRLENAINETRWRAKVLETELENEQHAASTDHTEAHDATEQKTGTGGKNKRNKVFRAIGGMVNQVKPGKSKTTEEDACTAPKVTVKDSNTGLEHSI